MEAGTEVVQKFQEFDLDGDGYISRFEMGHILKIIDKDAWTDHKVWSLMQSFDFDSDGKLSYEEFIAWIFETPETRGDRKGPQAWKVVGGEHTGGIVVRNDRGEKEFDKLQHGTIVYELEREGNKLKYYAFFGTVNPDKGWVSIKVKGKVLMRRVDEALAAPPLPAAKDLHAAKELEVSQRVRNYFLCLQEVIGPRPDSITPSDEMLRHSRTTYLSFEVLLGEAQDLKAKGELSDGLDEIEYAVFRFYVTGMHNPVNAAISQWLHDSGLNASLFTLASAYFKMARIPREHPNVFYTVIDDRECITLFGVHTPDDIQPGMRAVSMTPCVAIYPKKRHAVSKWEKFKRYGVTNHFVAVIHGRPADDVFHTPIDIGRISPAGTESNLLKEHHLPMFTAILTTSPAYTDDDCPCVNMECSFSPQMLSELIRPTKDVWEAVCSGDETTLVHWLKKHPVMDLEFEHPKFRCSMLYSACRFGHVMCAKALVESCAQINSQLNSTQSTALHAAASFGHPELVEFLLQHLADPTLRNSHNLTPVDEAAANTKHLMSGLASSITAVTEGLKLAADATELHYGDRAGFMRGLQALLGTPVLNLEQEWQGRPTLSWTNKYGSNLAGQLWPLATCHCEDEGLMDREQTQKANLTYDEVLSCVLYTGDGYTPLNNWLRQLGRAVHESRDDQVAQLRGREASFASTVLHIVSAMQKLVKADSACPQLVRGIEGKLPDDFFVPDARGMVSLTEYGFMSTSRDTTIAEGFGGGEGSISVIMNIVTKGEDAFGYHNGVDLEWLTMNPGEEETLFPPGTVFDVVSRRREGMRITLTVRPTFIL